MKLKTTLFNQFKRTEEDTASFSEPEYDYLNRTARKDCGLVRDILEEWFSRYPEKYKAELLSRFKAGDDKYRSAFYELYIHELLLRFGYEIEVHPDIKGKSTHPEFLVYKNKKPLFYLEATVVSHSDKEKSVINSQNCVYDIINKLDSPNFFLAVDVIKKSISSPSGTSLNRKLKSYLSKLNPDEKERGNKKIPSLTIEDNGWVIRFDFEPKPPVMRGNPSIKPIGIISLDAKWQRGFKENEPIRNAIKKKNSKYGELNISLVIAVNIWDIYFREGRILDALFGDEMVTSEKSANGHQHFYKRRIPNGAWMGPKGPRCKRVSAVLYSVTLNPYHISKQTPILWHNPWAKRPVDHSLWPLPQKKLIFDNIETINGKTINEIFAISYRWPYFEEP